MTVSVVIPAFNARETVRGCLESLLNQSVDKSNYEIIVVDDGSADTTVEIVKEYLAVKLLSQGNQGPAAARNRGAAEAKGDIILFTDADCKPSPDWIEEMIKPFGSKPEIVGVKGCYKTNQNKIVARFVQLEYEDKYDRMRKSEFIDFIDTYSAAFRRDIFLRTGGYDVSFPVACAEDVDFSYRLSNKGYKMVFNSNAVVFHRHPDTLCNYLRKKFKFARWRVLAVKKNPAKAFKDSHTPQIMKIQVMLIPLIFLSFAAGFGLQLYSVPLVAVSIYFATTIPFSLKAVKKDTTLGFLSPLLLFARSLAQFTGVLYGFLRIRTS